MTLPASTKIQPRLCTINCHHDKGCIGACNQQINRLVVHNSEDLFGSVAEAVIRVRDEIKPEECANQVVYAVEALTFVHAREKI